MPYDEYKCEIHRSFDVRRSIHDAVPSELPCPQCNKPSPKQISTFSHRSVAPVIEWSGDGKRNVPPEIAMANVRREKEAERLYSDRRAAYDKESKIKIPGIDMPPLEEKPSPRDVLTSGDPGAPRKVRQAVRRGIRQRKAERIKKKSERGELPPA